MALVLTADQKSLVAPSVKDKYGNPARVDGALEFAVSDPAVLALVPAADGLSAEVVAVGPAGTAQLTVRGDADLGEGVRPLVGTLDVEVIAGSAAVIALVAGSPVAKE